MDLFWFSLFLSAYPYLLHPLILLLSGDYTAHAQQGQFAPGSMLPKVKASMKFAASKAGRKAVICSLENAALALSGKSGTIVKQ